MQLDDIAYALKSGSLQGGVREALPLLAHLPALLRLFACDCAERMMWRMTHSGEAYDQAEWEAITTARLVLEGERQNIALKHAHQSVHGSWQGRSMRLHHTPEGSKAVERANITWVFVRDPLGAAWGATLHSDEPTWQSTRLAWLCECWSICGERTAFLIREQQMPIEEPEDARIQPLSTPPVPT